jgi:flagellar protein FlgJ
LLNPFGITPQPYSDSTATPTGRANESVITATRASDAKPLRGTERARHFAQQLMPHAEAASRETGIPARFLIGHAALESGWGRFEPRGADGARSYNLFGIKAGKNWTGPVVEARTSEYVDGRRVVTVERFRAYESYADAFRDYSDFLRGNRRYANVLEHSQRPEEFARGLQKAGYATDPAYANKLVRILNGRLLRETAMA